LINIHSVKTWVMAEGDVGNKEPLQWDGSWLVATVHNLYIVSWWGENEHARGFYCTQKYFYFIPVG
jgi:hypothetical protein